MSSATRVQLAWDAPESVWDRFTDAVADEWGAESPYAGIQIEESWREFKAADEQHAFEQVVERIVEATPRSLEADDEKELLKRSPADQTTKVWVRVHEDVKLEMKQYADECGVPYHIVLRGVLEWYLGGGREGRLREKLEGVVEDIESAFDVVGDEETVTKTERVTTKIASQLGDAFNEDDLADAIDAETSGTEYYHDTYAPRVIEKKGVWRWENDDRPDTFLPPETWKAKRTSAIIEALGGNTAEDTAPAFDKEDFAKAASRAGIEVAEANRDEVEEYKERTLDRLDFWWNAWAERFEPCDEDEDPGDEPRPEVDITSYSAGPSPEHSFDEMAAGHPAQEGTADD